VLLIEDNRDLAIEVTEFLAAQGHVVAAAERWTPVLMLSARDKQDPVFIFGQLSGLFRHALLIINPHEPDQ
jgi:hypothetical protein